MANDETTPNSTLARINPMVARIIAEAGKPTPRALLVWRKALSLVLNIENPNGA
jgi:hypothetical protein